MPNFSQGPYACGTGINSPFGAGPNWFTPDGIEPASPNTATVDLASGSRTSNLLEATNFGFTLPAASTVLGFQCSFTRSVQSSTAGSTIQTNTLTALKASTALGSGPANLPNPDFWELDDTQVTFGGPTDLWGATWLQSDINNSGFGFGIKVHDNDSDPDDVNTAFAFSMYATVFFQINSGTGSNGGVTAFERIACYPANASIWAFDPASGFNDPTDSGSYFWRVEELMVGRKPTISRLFVSYRDLGLVTVKFTLTAVQDDQTVVTNSATVVLGNAVPTGYLMTKEVDVPLSGMNLQLSMSRAAGAGPLSIAKIKVCGRVEMDSYS